MWSTRTVPIHGNLVGLPGDSYGWNAIRFKLQPWVHYVPLKPDYTDLLEKVQWCEAHANDCERISRNARMYMGMFMDEKVEQELENKVLRRYVAALRASA